MPLPLLALQDISLTFGVVPLLSGAALTVAAGDRICLVGRNGSGKSTLLRIAAGLVEPDAGGRFAQPGATIRYLPQEPDLHGFSAVLDYVEAGFDAGGDRRSPPGAVSAQGTRPYRRRGPRILVRRRGAPRRAGPRAGARSPTSCCSTSRPTISTCPAIEWLEARAGRHALRHRADQP